MVDTKANEKAREEGSGDSADSSGPDDAIVIKLVDEVSS
jgi:hypothetical protein